MTIEGSWLGVGSTGRASLGEEEIRGIIVVEAAKAVREATLELFGMAKAAMITLFDDRYDAPSEVVVFAVIGARGAKALQYR